jgi:HAE1 family hydrophobic/amphiphilic exporter-1
MTLIAIVVLGILAWTRLPAELNPRVDIPTLTVTTIYPGAGPQEIETLITRPLEDAVGTVNNVKDVFSSSQESVSIISIDFNIGTNLDHAFSAVREKVETARALLPLDARSPIVARLDINAQPVLYIGISAGVTSRELRALADTRLKPALSRSPGVAAVDVVGGEQREIQVRVDPHRLDEYGLTIEDVVNSIKATNRNIPAGNLIQGRSDIAVRSLSSFTGLEDIRRTRILAPQLEMNAASLNPGQPSPPQAPLTIGDLAIVSDGIAPTATITRVNGRDSIGLIITKVADANTVDVVNDVKNTLQSLRAILPSDASIVISRDDSVTVKDALDDVDATLVLGAILAMCVVFLFLHTFRGTIIVSVALPSCMVATFLVMHFAGYTLNQMTLLALSLSVGILIDDSIVVLESITRHLRNGEPPDEAALNGRSEIGFADITTTLVDVVVFLPIAFMGGIVGAFFRQFGLTVAAATLFSLLVSFTVTPSLASRWYRQGEMKDEKEESFGRLERMYKAMERLYRRALNGAMRNRPWVIASGIVALAAVLLVSLPTLGFEFLPATDQGQIAITVELPADASLQATDIVVRKIESKLVGIPDLRNYVSTTGEILGGFGSIPQQGAQFAQINVRLKDKQGALEQLLTFGHHSDLLRTKSDDDIASVIRTRLQDIQDGRITVSTVRTVANVGPPVQIQLRGTDLDALASAAAQLKERLKQMPGILDAESTMRTGRPEEQVYIDRARAAALGIAPVQAGLILRDSLEGNTDSSMMDQGIEYPIRIRLSGLKNGQISDLMSIPVGSNGNGIVSLNQVADIQNGAGPIAIERDNGQREVTVTANLAPGYALGNAQSDITSNMADIPMPGIKVHWGGESEAMSENISYFVMAFVLAILLVYLVMASLFNSLLNPFIIMFTLPMALVGAMGALAITHESLSLVALIGIIMLMGLMGRNAILLIDYIGTLRARGMKREEAVAEAGATRLRPILMTTFATIFGMLPVALRIGRASELRAPMAIVVIGGLLVSTILTLLVIPVVYTLFDDWFNRKRS